MEISKRLSIVDYFMLQLKVLFFIVKKFVRFGFEAESVHTSLCQTTK